MIDNHPEVRTYLATRLEREADIKVVCQSGSRAEIIECTAQYEPHIILIDPEIRKAFELEFLRFVITKFSNIDIIVLTTIVDTWTRVELGKLGIERVLNKEIHSEQLVEIIRDVFSVRAAKSAQRDKGIPHSPHTQSVYSP